MIKITFQLKPKFQLFIQLVKMAPW